MKFNSIFHVVFLKILLCVYSIKLRSLETMIDPENLKRANGEEIMKILNLDKNKSNTLPGDVEIEEAEVLKHKLKKSDINSFEEYLESYLKILRKMNKEEKERKTKNIVNMEESDSNHNEDNKIFTDKKTVQKENPPITQVKKQKEILINNKTVSSKDSSKSIFEMINENSTNTSGEKSKKEVAKEITPSINNITVKVNKTEISVNDTMLQSIKVISIDSVAKINNTDDIVTDFNSTKSIDNFMLSTKSLGNITIDPEVKIQSNHTLKKEKVNSTNNINKTKSQSNSTIMLSTPGKNTDIMIKNLSNVQHVNFKSDNSTDQKDTNNLSRLSANQTVIKHINIDNPQIKNYITNNKNLTSSLNTTNTNKVNISHENTTELKTMLIPENYTTKTVNNSVINTKSQQYPKSNLNFTQVKLTANPIVMKMEKIEDKPIQHPSSLDNNSHYIPTKENSVYENLRKRKEEFDEIEKSNEKKEKRPSKRIETESVEYKMYKRIIEISVSLIVIGLFMGILLGIIIVFYFNSKK